MKHLLLSLISFLFVTACGNPEHFASISEESSALESTQEPKYNERIQALVTENVEEIKISGKKRKTVNIVDTLGKSNLREVEKAVTRIDVASQVVIKQDVETQVEVEEEKAEVEKKTQLVVSEVEADQTEKQQVEAPDEKQVETIVGVKVEQKTVIETLVETDGEQVEEKPKDMASKLNVLVYMHQRGYGACVDRLRYQHKAFLEGISTYNWDVSFAYYTDKADLIPLEGYNGRPHNTLKLSDGGLFRTRLDYTLSKGEYSAKDTLRLFRSTLEPTHPNHSENSSINLTPNFTKLHVLDPLSGLNQILSSRVRKGAKTIILLFGDDFPYYSTKEWDEFYSEHPHVSIVVLSYRSANVSNFLHVLETKHDFSFVAACDKKYSQTDGFFTKSVLDVISEKVD